MTAIMKAQIGWIPLEIGALSRQVNSAVYAGPGAFAGQTVLVVGGGNRGERVRSELTAPLRL